MVEITGGSMDHVLRVEKDGEVVIQKEVQQQLDRIEEMLRLLISDRKLTQHLNEKGYK